METINSPQEQKINWISKINPKILATVVVVLVLGGLAFYYKGLFIAATVDGHIINRIDIIKKLEKSGGKNALDAMIDDQLIRNAANKINITASDDDINKKINNIKTQIESQGSTIEEALIGAGLTMDELHKQVDLQVKLEKLLGDKVVVTDDEVNKYIADNKVPLTAGKEDETKNQVKEQLKSEKFNSEAAKFLSELRTSAKIKTYVNY